MSDLICPLFYFCTLTRANPGLSIVLSLLCPNTKALIPRYQSKMLEKFTLQVKSSQSDDQRNTALVYDPSIREFGPWILHNIEHSSTAITEVRETFLYHLATITLHRFIAANDIVSREAEMLTHSLVSGWINSLFEVVKFLLLFPHLTLHSYLIESDTVCLISYFFSISFHSSLMPHRVLFLMPHLILFLNLISFFTHASPRPIPYASSHTFSQSHFILHSCLTASYSLCLISYFFSISFHSSLMPHYLQFLMPHLILFLNLISFFTHASPRPIPYASSHTYSQPYLILHLCLIHILLPYVSSHIYYQPQSTLHSCLTASFTLCLI
ncbi:hypothetical protein RRG08_008274 [Elysia crispata]|uniref:Uncharacterized protein n=1 Tax=Elysia crispata TaxID=231223 RepID=A0AAE1DIP1_9GAST|nr:hypothetical protein RRG08_008274 [Elysia crispata]